MDPRHDAPRPDTVRPAAPVDDATADAETTSARDALRATPNQHSFEDDDPGDDAARNYHGAEDPA